LKQIKQHGAGIKILTQVSLQILTFTWGVTTR